MWLRQAPRSSLQRSLSSYYLPSGKLTGQCAGMHGGNLIKRPIKGIIFDMDGTCTEPVIDFKEMRRRAGIHDGDILGVLDSLSPGKREKALQAIEEVEQEALPRMRLMPGLQALCNWLDSQCIPRGIVTRNGQVSVDFFHEQHFKARAFSPALCRDFKPYKPSPAGILYICQIWGILPEECMMVGDSPKDDVVSGNRAGAVTVLLEPVSKTTSAPVWGCDTEEQLRPHIVIRSLPELKDALEASFSLESPTLPRMT